jgi:hypothetical protein
MNARPPTPPPPPYGIRSSTFAWRSASSVRMGTLSSVEAMVPATLAQPESSMVLVTRPAVHRLTSSRFTWLSFRARSLDRNGSLQACNGSLQAWKAHCNVATDHSKLGTARSYLGMSRFSSATARCRLGMSRCKVATARSYFEMSRSKIVMALSALQWAVASLQRAFAGLSLRTCDCRDLSRHCKYRLALAASW